MVIENNLTDAENAELDLHLESYRQRTKLRGKTFSERLEEVVLRWEKIAEDCLNNHDQSEYRRSFGETHERNAKIFRIGMTSTQFTQEEMVRTFLNGTRHYLFRYCHPIHNPPGTPYWAAAEDSLSYTIVECEAILKTS